VGNQWRRNAGFILENSIVLGFKTGLLLDGCQSETKYLGSAPVDSLKANLVHSYNTGAQFLTTGACFSSAAFGTKAGVDGNTAYSSVSSIGLLAPFSRTTVGFYQPVSAPALTGFVNAGLSTTPNCCGFSFTTDREFRGAFGPEEDDDWAFGWARF
jgi:hypothetical protein